MGEENLSSRVAGAFHWFVNIAEACGAVEVAMWEAGAAYSSCATVRLGFMVSGKKRVCTNSVGGRGGASFLFMADLLALVASGSSVFGSHLVHLAVAFE